MKPFRKIVADLLGFDRRERRGTLILAVMLLALLLVRVLAFRPDGEMHSGDSFTGVLQEQNPVVPDETSATEHFTFDPNTATPDELSGLGLSERQIRTLINYRSSGARFRKPGDLLKVYGIDSATAERLAPRVRIAEGTNPASPDTDPERVPLPEVPFASSPSEARPPAESDKIIDLNLCTVDDLLPLPGIGPVLSQRIIKYRSLLGGYVDAEQLKEVYGLDSSVAELIAGRLTMTFDSVRPLLLDSASYREMSAHPYIGNDVARLITKYRSLIDTPLTLGGLVSQRIVSHEQALRLAPYVRPSPGADGTEYEFILSKVLK